MSAFKGETVVSIEVTPFAGYKSLDWALAWIKRYSGIDGEHHKAWLIDQIARIHHGNEVIIKLAEWQDGAQEWRFSLAEPTDKYHKWVREMKNGEDGENTYYYDVGIAP